MTTQFYTVQEDRISADWPDSRHTLLTRIEGDLADRIRTRSGKTGEVLLREYGEEGGYSDVTVEWDYDFTVSVDGEVVFYNAWAGYEACDKTPNAHLDDYIANFGLRGLLEWLNGKEEN